MNTDITFRLINERTQKTLTSKKAVVVVVAKITSSYEAFPFQSAAAADAFLIQLQKQL